MTYLEHLIANDNAEDIITVQVPENSLIITPYMDKGTALELFADYIKEYYSDGN